MSTTAAPTTQYRGRFRITNGPDLGRLLDSLKYRYSRDTAVAVTFELVLDDGRALTCVGQISAFSYGGYANHNIVDITFDGPAGPLTGWYDTGKREGLLNART